MATYGAWSTNGHTALGFDVWYTGQTLNVQPRLATHWSYSGNTPTINYNGTWSGSYAVGSTTRSNPSEAPIGPVLQFTQGYGTTATINFSISGFYDAPGSNAYVTLNSYLASPIPAPGTPTMSLTTFDMGNTGIVVNANRTVGDQAIQMYWQFGSLTRQYITNGRTVGRVTAASATWDTSLDLAAMAGELPNSTSGTGTIYCDYWDSSGNYCGTTTVDFTANIPSTIAPTISSFVITDVSSPNGLALTGKYVSTKSIAHFAITSSVTSPSTYGSTIVSTKVLFNGADSGWYGPDIPINTGAASIDVTASVTDSRGRTTTTAVQTIGILQYAPPVISTPINYFRCDSAGVANPLGTYARVTWAASSSPLMNGTAKNSLGYKLTIKKLDGTVLGTEITKLRTDAPMTNSVDKSLAANGDTMGGGLLDAATSYNLYLTLTDIFGSPAATSVLITSGQVTMSWSDKGIGVGKVWQQGALDVAGDISVGALGAQPGNISMSGALTATGNISTVSGTINQWGVELLPAGVIVPYAVPSYVPGGWLLCNGQAISRSAYSRLFSVISTFYGAGNGSTTFNLPNLSGRVPIGSGNSGAAGATTHTQGQVGGEETHVLLTAEMPSHSHSQVVTAAVGGSGVRTDYASDAASSAFPQGVNTGSTGGDGAHNNMQPYLSMNYIIKY